MPSVLHVLTSDQRRGAETFGVTLSQSLAGLGWRSDVVALTSATADGLQVDVLGPHVRAGTTFRRLRRRARGYDVVVAHGSSTLPACALSLVGTGPPFVYVNIGDPLFWASTPSRRLRVRILLRRAAAVAAIAEGAGAILVSRFGVERERLTVLPNARSGDDFRPATALERRCARQRLGLTAGQSVLVSLGALSPEKRVDVAIRAVAAVPGVQLLVAGEGALRPQLERLAEQVAPGQVLFLGAVARPSDVLRAADGLLLTSDSEGVPGVLIEAGLSGLAALTTDVGWVREVVQDGRTGVVVPPDDVGATADGLRRLLSRREQMGAAARASCLQRFHLPVVVGRWDSLLRDLVLARRPPPFRRARTSPG